MSKYEPRLNRGHEVFYFETADLLRDLIVLTTAKWRDQINTDVEGVHLLIKGIQELIFWPWIKDQSFHNKTGEEIIIAGYEQGGLRFSLNSEEGRLAHMLWRRLSKILPIDQKIILTTWLHIWNPVTEIRATEPLHFWEKGEEVERRLNKCKYELYLRLDKRGQEAITPLYTANQLLQRTPFPTCYNIHWEVNDSQRTPGMINVNYQDAAIFSRYLEDVEDKVQQITTSDSISQDESLDRLANDIFGRYEEFYSTEGKNLKRLTQNLLVLFPDTPSRRIDGHTAVNERQALYFYFGLALLWKILKCRHLYQFPLMQGNGCSIASYVTNRNVSRKEYWLFEHFAYSVLYPLLLQAFHSAKEDIERSVWFDWSHEVHLPLTVIMGGVERIENCIASIKSTETTKVSAEHFREMESAIHNLRSSASLTMKRAQYLSSVRKRTKEQIESEEIVIVPMLRSTIEDAVTCVGMDFHRCSSICRRLLHCDTSSLSKPLSEIVTNIVGVDKNDEITVCQLITKLLYVLLEPRIEEASPKSILCSSGAIQLVLLNLCLNTIDNCDWKQLSSATEGDILSVSLKTGPNNSAIICFTNRCESQRSTEFEKKAGTPPLPYRQWWTYTARREAWGGRLTLIASRFLGSDFSNESGERWLMVTNYRPFTVSLTLPTNAPPHQS